MGVGQGGGHVGQHSDIVGVASGVGVVNGEASSHLANSVGISLSLPLAVVSSVVHSRDGGVGVDSGGIDSSVANGANSRDEAMAVVNTSDDTAIGGTMGNLTHSVGVTAGA